MFKPYSNKKVWWKCPKGHEWQSTIENRTHGRNCPYCSNKKVNNENCLATINPMLSKEWLLTKNNPLTPHNVLPNSHHLVWWVCKKGHEWRASVLHRNNGSGCPYCSNKKVNNENCLAKTNKRLAKQWHPIKNEKLTAKGVVKHSNKKVWWKCPKGHEWQAVVESRTGKGKRGCPYCSGRFATKKNNLRVLLPNVAKYWHPTKNGALTPKNVLPHSHKKVWWRCPTGHVTKASIDSRSTSYKKTGNLTGNGCLICWRNHRKIRGRQND